MNSKNLEDIFKGKEILNHKKTRNLVLVQMNMQNSLNQKLNFDKFL